MTFRPFGRRPPGDRRWSRGQPARGRRIPPVRAADPTARPAPEAPEPGPGSSAPVEPGPARPESDPEVAPGPEPGVGPGPEAAGAAGERKRRRVRDRQLRRLGQLDGKRRQLRQRRQGKGRRREGARGRTGPHRHRGGEREHRRPAPSHTSSLPVNLEVYAFFLTCSWLVESTCPQPLRCWRLAP